MQFQIFIIIIFLSLAIQFFFWLRNKRRTDQFLIFWIIVLHADRFKDEINIIKHLYNFKKLQYNTNWKTLINKNIYTNLLKSS